MESLKVGLTDWIAYAPFLLAQEYGYYDGWNIEFRTRLDSTKRYELFRESKLDCIATSINAFCLEVPKAHAQVILALVQPQAPGTERVVAKKSYRSINELQNATICFVPNGLEHFYFRYFFKQADVSFPRKVLRAESREEMRERFINGEADAVILYEPLISRLTASGTCHVIPMDADLSVIAAVLAARFEVVEKQHDQLRALVDGFLRAVVDLESRATEALTILLRYYGANYREQSPLDDLRRKFEGLRYLDRAENKVFLTHTEQGLHRAIKESVDIWQEIGALNYPLDTTRLINPAFATENAESAPC